MRYPAPKWPPNKLPEAVAKYNQLVDTLNIIVPQIVDVIHGTQVTRNSVGKTARDRITTIVCSTPGNIHIYLDTSYIYSVYLVARCSSPRGDNPHDGVEYVEQSICIATRENGDMKWTGESLVKPLVHLCLADVQQQLLDVELAIVRRDEAEEQLRMAAHKCRQFLKGV
jgi:hypothetical protein